MSSSSTRVAFVTALVFGAVPCVSAQDDPAAVDRLLQRAETAARALPGFRCEASRSNISVTRTATDVSQVAFLRPNFFRVVQKEGGGQRTSARNSVLGPVRPRPRRPLIRAPSPRSSGNGATSKKPRGSSSGSSSLPV